MACRSQIDHSHPTAIAPKVITTAATSRPENICRSTCLRPPSKGSLASPLLAHGFIDRFGPVDDAAYDDIRAMLATIQAAGWTSLTQAAAEF
jgi:hypothetical protein